MLAWVIFSKFCFCCVYSTFANRTAIANRLVVHVKRLLQLGLFAFGAIQAALLLVCQCFFGGSGTLHRLAKHVQLRCLGRCGSAKHAHLLELFCVLNCLGRSSREELAELAELFVGFVEHIGMVGKRQLCFAVVLLLVFGQLLTFGGFVILSF